MFILQITNVINKIISNVSKINDQIITIMTNTNVIVALITSWHRRNSKMTYKITTIVITKSLTIKLTREINKRQILKNV